MKCFSLGAHFNYLYKGKFSVNCLYDILYCKVPEQLLDFPLKNHSEHLYLLSIILGLQTRGVFIMH